MCADHLSRILVALGPKFVSFWSATLGLERAVVMKRSRLNHYISHVEPLETNWAYEIVRKEARP